MFSVMIPCHDPDPAMLEVALRSVRRQLSPGSCQLCVVDDASADPAPAARLAARYGAEHVRPDAELGGVRAHNLCLELARHELVHLLHPDDWTLDGFYAAVARAAELQPDAALYAADYLYADAAGLPFARAPVGAALFPGFPPMHHGNPLAVAGCVTRRSFYAGHGGWREDLPHTADWEYWRRCHALGGSAAVRGALAVFRQHPHQHTARLARDAANLRDYLGCAAAVSEYAPVDWPAFRNYVAQRALGQASLFRASGDLAAVAANEELARELQEAAHAAA